MKIVNVVKESKLRLSRNFIVLVLAVSCCCSAAAAAKSLLLSCVQLFVTLWTITHQAPLSMGFSRQEYWSGLLCLPPEDLPDPGIKPVSPVSPEMQADSLPLSQREAQ